MVYATTGLIDAVTQRVGIDGAERPFFELVAPFLPWVGLLLVLRLVEHLIQADPFSRYLSLHLGLRSMRRLEAWVFGKAVALRLEWFEYPRYYDTLQRATEAMDEQWQSWSLLQIKNLIANAFALAGILFALSGIHWGVPLIMLAGTAILVAGHAFQSKRYVDVNFSQTPTRRRKEYWGKLLTERTAAAEVRLFGLTRHILSSWLRTTEQMLREKAATRVRNLPVGVPAILASLGLFGVVIFALILAAEAGTVTAGGVVAYLYITQQYIRRVSDFGWRTRQAQQFLAELRYMPEFLNLEREERRDGSAAPAKLARGIRFEGVSFTYPGSEEPALSEVDLEIRPEERVALVGENGAGKTTLTKLLLGLYEPTDGRITVDGTDLREIDPASWRDRVGSVFQDYMRYAATARENIAFGRVDRIDDFDAIRSAAELSGAARAIDDLPDGYDTLLGREFEGGRDLSRGEWQELALARLYLRDPQLLVLDEPTSALDALAEMEV